MSAAGDAALAPGVDTPDQAALRDSVRSLLEKRAGSEEMRAATRAEHGYDESLWSALAGQIGASALGIPETYDGAGASYLETHLVADELRFDNRLGVGLQRDGDRVVQLSPVADLGHTD